MNKLRDFRISIERLVKVWKSKLENGEEELLADDLRWFVEIFDRFFDEKNINDYININGRYVDVDLFEGFDLDSYFEQLSFSNEELGIVRPKYFERSRDEVNREINVSINEEIYYNVFEVYLNVLKRVAGFANNSSLRITQIRLRTVLRKIFFKVMTYESKGFKSVALLKDFLDESVFNALTDEELKNSFPSKEFVCLVYFLIIMEVYSQSFIDSKKALVIRAFLLRSWLKLMKSKRPEYLDEFIKALSQKTISDIRIKEIDLFALSRLIPGERLNHEFIELLRSLEEKRRRIITEEDLNIFSDKYDDCISHELPQGIEEEDRLYFVKTEKDYARELFKFRQLQSLVLEILGIVYHHNGKEGVLDAFRLLRKNEDFSNQKSFFPKTEFEVFAWLLIVRNLKFDISGRYQGSVAYRYLDFLLSFIVSKSFERGFVIDNFKSVISSYGLFEDSGATNSLNQYVTTIAEEVINNPLLEEAEIQEVIQIWTHISQCLEEGIESAEREILIPANILNSFQEKVVSGYKDRSLIFKIKEVLSAYKGSPTDLNNFMVSASRNEFILRKYLIPNWHVPLYGLADSVSIDLANQESIQFEIKVFNELDVTSQKSLKRDSVLSVFKKITEQSIVLFKNSYPEYWLGKNIHREGKLDDGSLFSVIRYNTYDKNPEIIIIPITSIRIEENFNSSLDSFERIGELGYWKFLDLAIDEDSRKEVEARPPDFLRDQSEIDNKLRKYLWLRIFFSHSIFIDPKQIVRYKLDPYGD